jgi:hypothetical protein
MFDKNLFNLAKLAATGKGYAVNTENFSAVEVKETLREELKKFVGDYFSFQRNKLDLFELISITIDDILPARVEATMGQFAEIRNLGQGVKATFRKKLGRMRAKQFVGRVSPAGIYETFRLDTETFDIAVHAIGGGIRMDWERYLDGTEDWSELLQIVLDGLEVAVYQEIALELAGSYNWSGRPANTKYATGSFDQTEMRELLNTVRAYGQGATIFATPEFVATMGDAVKYGVTGATQNVSPKDIDDLRSTGFIGMFYGAPIVQIPNTFTDESNTALQINPEFAYILPTGGEKVVKVAFEGQTIVNEHPQAIGDMSMEMMVYKKFGTAILYTNNWGIYQNTALL